MQSFHSGASCLCALVSVSTFLFYFILFFFFFLKNDLLLVSICLLNAQLATFMFFFLIAITATTQLALDIVYSPTFIRFDWRENIIDDHSKMIINVNWRSCLLLFYSYQYTLVSHRSFIIIKEGVEKKIEESIFSRKKKKRKKVDARLAIVDDV